MTSITRKPEQIITNKVAPAPAKVAAPVAVAVREPVAVKQDSTFKTLSDNLLYSLDGTVLTVRVDLARTLYQSATGKSFIIASSHGNQPLPGMEDVKIGINIFTPAA